MRRKILTYLYFMLILIMSVSVFAKKNEPPEPPNNKNNDISPPVGLPIDGGFSYLLIVGAVYGVYAIRKKFTIDD